VLHDCRVDRDAVGDPHSLVLLTYERLYRGSESTADPDRLLRALPNGQWALLVLNVLQGLVENGGFALFLHSSGGLLEDVVAAARFVEAEPYVPLLRDAVALFPAGLPHDEYERDVVLGAWSGEPGATAALTRLDERFAAVTHASATDLVGHALAYVERHPEEFFLSGAEAAGELDHLIARLRERAGRVPRAGDADVAILEARLARRLPELPRRLLQQVGDGGWGPRRGMLGSAELARVAEQSRSLGCWSDDLLPICSIGQRLYCVQTSEPALPVRVVRRARRLALPHAAGVADAATSLRDWLEDWLARSAP